MRGDDPLKADAAAGASRSDALPGAWILSTKVNAIDWSNAIKLILGWAQAKENRYVCVCNVHMVVEAERTAQVAQAVRGGDLVVPDGMPLVWLLRKLGYPDQSRISGPDLFRELCAGAAKKNVRVFLLGSSPQTLERMTRKLEQSLPALRIAGTYSPTYAGTISAPDLNAIKAIREAQADLVFVSLGCPKQETWMAVHRAYLPAVTIGVGAAFDFEAGTVKRAPAWMQRSGLEWLYRVCAEPRRLWRRYLATNTFFMVRITSLLLRRRLGHRPSGEIEIGQG